MKPGGLERAVRIGLVAAAFGATVEASSACAAPIVREPTPVMTRVPMPDYGFEVTGSAVEAETNLAGGLFPLMGQPAERNQIDWVEFFPEEIEDQMVVEALESQTGSRVDGLISYQATGEDDKVSIDWTFAKLEDGRTILLLGDEEQTDGTVIPRNFQIEGDDNNWQLRLTSGADQGLVLIAFDGENCEAMIKGVDGEEVSLALDDEQIPAFWAMYDQRDPVLELISTPTATVTVTETAKPTVIPPEATATITATVPATREPTRKPPEPTAKPEPTATVAVKEPTSIPKPTLKPTEAPVVVESAVSLPDLKIPMESDGNAAWRLDTVDWRYGSTNLAEESGKGKILGFRIENGGAMVSIDCDKGPGGEHEIFIPAQNAQIVLWDIYTGDHVIVTANDTETLKAALEKYWVKGRDYVFAGRFRDGHSKLGFWRSAF